MGLFASLYARFFLPARSDKFPQSVYEFKLHDIEGNVVDLADYSGKKLLIVNTASKCGYTPQYSELEKLHQEYGDRVAVLGFPSNNFFGQEPGSEQTIAEFCQRNFGVTFKLFKKTDVIGRKQHPLYQWLYHRTGRFPTWNFCKYLITKDGRQVKFFPTKISPLHPTVINQILK
jgi:glutathione peroxidase